MTQENLVLMVQRKINASPERVFDAWTKPELMAKWFHADEKWTTPVAEADLRVGGAWRLEMRTTEGRLHPCKGKYKVIERPHKLVFTWHPYGNDDYETTVTLSLKKVSGNVTELTLTHEGLRGAEDQKNHTQGWNGCLDTLARWADQGGK